MFRRIRRLVPKPIKRALRGLATPALAAARRRALRRGVTLLRREAAVGPVSTERLALLRSAWGNEGFVADVEFLAAVAERVRTGPGPFLDCGSGLTTITAGAIADASGARVYSLEQDEGWHDEVRDLLPALGIGSVDLRHTPLRAYDDFAWFDLRGHSLPREFSHVICDGPAINRKHWPEPLSSAWRAGVVPVLRSLGVGFGEILLDDAEDARSAGLRTRWEALGLATRVVDTPTGAWIHALPGQRPGTPADTRAEPGE